MNACDVERLLELLDETCFPVQIDWNNKDLYIKGLKQALDQIEVEIEERGEASLLD